MKTWTSLLITISVLFQAMIIAQTNADFEVPTTNPGAIVQQKIAATTVEIEYHRPSMKGRVIFGNLVPFDQVWRTGADQATKISFSTPVKVEGIEIDSGHYELFTVPGQDRWTVILQRDQSQWGSYRYDQSKDVLRAEVKPVQTKQSVESFTISVDDVKNNEATMHIAWAQTRVPLTIQVDLEKTVLPQIEEALQSGDRPPYFCAAMFYYENDIDIDRAAELMALALEQHPGHIGMLYRQALILEKKGDIKGAVAAAELSLAGAAEVGPELREEYTRLNSELLARLRK